MSIEKIQGLIINASESATKMKKPAAVVQQVSEKFSDALNPASREIYQNQGLMLHYDKLKRRLEELNLFKPSSSGCRFGKDGIKSILECADSQENIAKINEMLDSLENGKDIWTYDIVSSLKKTNSSQSDMPRFFKTPSDLSGMPRQVLRTATGSPVCGPVKEIFTKKSKLPEVIALEKEMEAMGYVANFSDNFNTAKIITKAYKTLTERGCKMPKEVALMVPESKGILGYRPFSTKENRLNVPILFSNELKNNKPEFDFFLSRFGVKHNISDSPESVVYHEIGHFLHEDTKLSPNEACKIWDKMANGGADLPLAREVGYYAMTGDKFGTGEEFVAEVFSGLMEGKTFGKKTMDIYKALNGPRV